MADDHTDILIILGELKLEIKHLNLGINQLVEAVKEDRKDLDDTRIKLAVLETKSSRALITAVVSAIAVVGMGLLKVML